MGTADADAGDWLVTQVVYQMGALSPDEQAAVYGAGFSYDSAGSQKALPANTAQWISTVLLDFRTHPCPFCEYGLLEHSLSIADNGPMLVCDSDGVSRSAWVWHAGPQPLPLWRILLAVVLWIGIPLTSIGLASWLMPTIAAFKYRQRRWALGAVIWGLLTVALITAIELGWEGSALGMLALLLWFGGALYGGLQIKGWLSAAPPNRPSRR
ncbi:MAG: hypothetical protein MUF33_10480 [Candidatus Nanopelagicales bacterium]|nr:hypothetical protein [Candidatus Nanopelagicales bacterium]